MPRWEPQPIWAGQDAFIIGGGPSLKGFDWTLLIPENTIGCNNAFRLGPEVCKVCLFVDAKFIFSEVNRPRVGYYDELAKFPNPVVTNDNGLFNRPEPWLKWIPRKHRSMYKDALGYNFSCGASAINLALLLGATRVYLLGVDMHLGSRGEPNWHDHIIDKPDKEVYDRMLSSFHWVKTGLANFPGCEVFNVNKNSSLQLFPTIDPDVFWAERRKKYEPDVDTNQ